MSDNEKMDVMLETFLGTVSRDKKLIVKVALIWRQQEDCTEILAKMILNTNVSENSEITAETSKSFYSEISS